MKHDVDAQLARLRAVRWTGPDRNLRVEQFLKEQSNMNEQKKHKGLAIGLIVALTLGGGALAAGVTHRMMSQRAIVQLDDGRTMEFDIVDEGGGRLTGVFVDEGGRTFHLEAVVDPGTKAEQGQGASPVLMPMRRAD
ncbi:MAG: hypothetical protein KF757_01880 [Phycisphaeraceae bacterium]|nr:hypothetical protein [Phycisphaeraceae bacterium]MCW5761960.1 hypothetical protein [Phycisphaeraceae bacterium]